MWSHDGIICTGESYKSVVKLTFAKGASLKDPARLFNSSLDGNVRRAIDIHEGEVVDESAFKALVRQAAALNSSGSRRLRRKRSLDDVLYSYGMLPTRLRRVHAFTSSCLLVTLSLHGAALYGQTATKRKPWRPTSGTSRSKARPIFVTSAATPQPMAVTCAGARSIGRVNCHA